MFGIIDGDSDSILYTDSGGGECTVVFRVRVGVGEKNVEMKFSKVVISGGLVCTYLSLSTRYEEIVKCLEFSVRVDDNTRINALLLINEKKIDDPPPPQAKLNLIRR